MDIYRANNLSENMIDNGYSDLVDLVVRRND